MITHIRRLWPGSFGPSGLRMTSLGGLEHSEWLIFTSNRNYTRGVLVRPMVGGVYSAGTTKLKKIAAPELFYANLQLGCFLNFSQPSQPHGTQTSYSDFRAQHPPYCLQPSRQFILPEDTRQVPISIKSKMFVSWPIVQSADSRKPSGSWRRKKLKRPFAALK